MCRAEMCCVDNKLLSVSTFWKALENVYAVMLTSKYSFLLYIQLEQISLFENKKVQITMYAIPLHERQLKFHKCA